MKSHKEILNKFPTFNENRGYGEEFVLILDTIKLEEAQDIADKLRKEVENLKFKTVNKITISIGVSEFKTKTDTFEDVFKKADQALYQAKTSGRNKVYIY